MDILHHSFRGLGGGSLKIGTKCDINQYAATIGKHFAVFNVSAAVEDQVMLSRLSQTYANANTINKSPKSK